MNSNLLDSMTILIPRINLFTSPSTSLHSYNFYITLKKVNAKLSLADSSKNVENCILKDPILIVVLLLSLNQILLSNSILEVQDLTFRREKKRNLYFLNSVISSKNISHSLKVRHEIGGQCNIKMKQNLEMSGKVWGLLESKFKWAVCTASNKQIPSKKLYIVIWLDQHILLPTIGLEQNFVL